MSTTPETHELAEIIKQRLNRGWCNACSNKHSKMWHLYQNQHMVVYRNEIEISKGINRYKFISVADPQFFNKLDAVLKEMAELRKNSK